MVGGRVGGVVASGTESDEETSRLFLASDLAMMVRGAQQVNWGRRVVGS